MTFIGERYEHSVIHAIPKRDVKRYVWRSIPRTALPNPQDASDINLSALEQRRYPPRYVRGRFLQTSLTYNARREGLEDSKVFLPKRLRYLLDFN